jgi:hypothetical protein
MIGLRATQTVGKAAVAASAMLAMAATPALAQDDDHGCARYARISCQVDGDDSYECFIVRYEACIAFHQGGGAGVAGLPLVRQDYP